MRAAVLLLLLLATPALAGTHLSPDDTGFISPDERGPIGTCEFTVLHSLSRDLVGCILGCSRPTRDPDKLGVCEAQCQVRYINQTRPSAQNMQGCPACLDRDGAAASFTSFAHDLNALIYADGPGIVACEGSLSNALENLTDCIATAQLQSGIAEIEPSAEWPKRARCMGTYAANVDRMGMCGGRDPTVTLAYGDYVLSFMRSHSHLPFCQE